MGYDFAGKSSEIGRSNEDSKSSQRWPNFWRSLALDCVVIVMPTVACLTVKTISASSHLEVLHLVILTFSLD